MTFSMACTGTLGSREPNIEPTNHSNAYIVASGTRFPRLTHAQYRNAAKSLLLLNDLPALDLQADSMPGATFDNQQSLLEVHEVLATQYREAAVTLANHVADDSAKLARLSSGSNTNGLEAKARGAIQALLARGFRRPATPEEINTYYAVFQASPRSAASDDERFRNGMRVVILSVLQSPKFLYRIELGDTAQAAASAAGVSVPLTSWELASRLSFALFDSPPDEALVADVQAGRLATADGLKVVVQRLLADARSLPTLRKFHQYLYGVPDYDGIVKHASIVPNNDELRSDAREESNRFFDYQLQHQGGLREMMVSRVAFVNKRLAGLYGLDQASYSDNQFTQVELPATRAGILTRVGWNSLEGDQLQRKSVLRGVFVLRNVLCQDLGPPAAGNFAAAAGRVPPTDAVTNRKIWTFKTEFGDCANCHQARINPAGFAFEAYDTVGRHVTEEAGQAVDSSGRVLMDGRLQSFTSPTEFVSMIAESEEAHRCYSSKAMQFALGYQGGTVEKEMASRLGELSRTQSLSTAALFEALLLSPEFASYRVPVSS